MVEAQRHTRPLSARFGSTFETLSDRLYDSINRGPLLKCFLTKSSASRVDITRFDTDEPVLDPDRKSLLAEYGSKMLRSSPDDFETWSRSMGRDLGSWVRPYLPSVWEGIASGDSAVDEPSSLSCRILDSLINNENGYLSFQLDISSENIEIREHNLAIYRALGQKIARTSDLIRKEAGLRSLWLGYPIFVAHDLSDPEDPTIVLAPLLLWAVDVQISLSRQGQIKLSRDPKVGPPSINRVLQNWVKNNLHVDLGDFEIEGNGAGSLSRDRLQTLLMKSVSGISRVRMDNLTEPLRRLPSKKEARGLAQPAVLNSAVLGIFVSENQALIDNLEGLKTVPEIDGPLESLLSGRSDIPRTATAPAEKDRYLVTGSDPFQEMAVWDARNAPGTVVHGPPGTGKSQTIVNIIADALAHRERVLVVCQKRAAIDVVSRRLNSAGLSQLCTVVHDSEGDRSRTILGLKEQIAAVGQEPRHANGAQRTLLSDEIEKRENELDVYYQALHIPRPEIGLSYRSLVSRLGTITIQNPGLHPSAEVGEVLSRLSHLSLRKVISDIKSISSVYDAASPKTNPWVNREHDFFLTASVLEQIKGAIFSCIDADAEHTKLLRTCGPGFSITDLDEFVAASEKALEVCHQITAAGDLPSLASRLGVQGASSKVDELQRDKAELLRLSEGSTSRFSDLIKDWTPDSVSEASELCTVVQRGMEGSWLVRIMPAFRRAAKRLRLLTHTGSSTMSADSMCDLKRECLLVLKSQSIEKKLDANGFLRNDNAQRVTGRLTTAIDELSRVCAIQALPVDIKRTVVDAVTKGLNAINAAISNLEIAQQRASLLFLLRARLSALGTWLRPSYLVELVQEACSGKSLASRFSDLIRCLSTIPHLVAFDAERKSLDRIGSTILEYMIREDRPIVAWEPLMLISAFTAWGEKCQEASPVLKTMDSTAYQSRKEVLEFALAKKRELEAGSILDIWSQDQQQIKQLRPSPFALLKSQLVTRGPNSKRLREVITIGADNGLFSLRPCWLTNPNTACQILPLQPHLFDVVVFDEASQCPVEQAVPVIYRGKRLVVSGDEKQLPPTSFFLNFSEASLDSESSDDESEELSDEQITDRALQKQVLSSKDLLTASEPFLRSSYLDMHYRSEHPALIEFSNYAFYGGRLQFPPAQALTDNNAAIEYRDVSGVYENKTNRTEARAVIGMLKEIWTQEPCPTVGVVTFNAQQQDLIQNLIQEEALRDSDFRLRYECEAAREEEQQQVGFFVKNLESVQGDERDVIIFSTTFGKDENGVFKRFFGPINREGGEKRLNVAVTRAKKRVCVVTSMPAFEISDAFTSRQDFEGQRVTGREYLQGYLLYAKAVSEKDTIRAQEILERARELAFSKDGAGVQTTADFDSDFEIAVYDALKSRGVVLDTQVGVAGFKIDLAVRHKDDPGRGYLMGIECDGKAFHSSFAARARDIWREQILRSRGWKLHHIWSSDWWANPSGEIDKVLSEIHRHSA